MHRFPRALILGLLALWAAVAHAGDLDRLDQVDLLELDAKNSQLQLLIILGEDRVNTRPALRTLYQKFNNYQDFIESGQALSEAPNANAKLRPVVVLVAPKEATSGEMQNLAGIKLAASKVGAEVEVRTHVPGLKSKPIRNKSVPTKSGA